jgi:hypothetical protein
MPAVASIIFKTYENQSPGMPSTQKVPSTVLNPELTSDSLGGGPLTPLHPHLDIKSHKPHTTQTHTHTHVVLPRMWSPCKHTTGLQRGIH